MTFTKYIDTILIMNYKHLLKKITMMTLRNFLDENNNNFDFFTKIKEDKENKIVDEIKINLKMIILIMNKYEQKIFKIILKILEKN